MVLVYQKHRHDTEDENDEWFMRVYGGAWNGLDDVNNNPTTYYSGHRVGLFVACLDWEGNAPYHQAEGSLSDLKNKTVDYVVKSRMESIRLFDAPPQMLKSSNRLNKRI